MCVNVVHSVAIPSRAGAAKDRTGNQRVLRIKLGSQFFYLEGKDLEAVRRRAILGETDDSIALDQYASGRPGDVWVAAYDRALGVLDPGARQGGGCKRRSVSNLKSSPVSANIHQRSPK